MFEVLIVLYVIITLWAIFSLILYGSRPSKSFSWLLALVLLPIIGVFLYVLFGLNHRKLKILTLKETSRRRLYNKNRYSAYLPNAYYGFTSKKSSNLAKLIKNNSNLHPYSGNKVSLLDDGHKTFESIFDAMEKAKKFIHVQCYIFEEGELSERLYRLFKEKIEQGLEIRVIYDALGSFSWRRKSINRFKALGIEVFPMMPLRFGRILFTINYRNHRKIIVVDGEVGFIGGANISDKYIKSTTELGIWDDMHLCIMGPAVTCLHHIFIKDYYFASKQDILVRSRYLPEVPKKGNSVVQIVASGPDSYFSAIMQQYISLINLAEKHIYIANPYFIPSSAVLEALKIASLSGVNVKLLVPTKSDSILVKHSMYSYFEELLRAKVQIYLNKEKFLHSKVIMIDDEIASVGSGNFDQRSFEQNFEVNAMIYDRNIAIALREDFEKDCANSTTLDFAKFIKRPLSNKLMEGFARIFSPLI